jgi:hypothetical protein
MRTLQRPDCSIISIPRTLHVAALALCCLLHGEVCTTEAVGCGGGPAHDSGGQV